MLNRPPSADYSTGEGFEYVYDAVGNRRMMTSTTPLSGTVVTTYTFDAANRLTDQVRSDNRAYTYTWSARGQMLAEYTQGTPVRTFSYDSASRMIEATVFTLTTRFHYNGLGARVAVEVVGHGTTTYTLDYAAGNRVLAEATGDGTVHYLYGRDCLGELRDDDWLYYLNDASGYVRQGADEQGEITSGWLFDPNGVVLEGPEGPVSHLVCGGVYDWSTGLIHKDGRYFDPMLGIWLALMPLVVVQSWKGRKKRRGFPWVSLLLLAACVSGVLTGCGDEAPWDELYCLEVTPLSPPLGKRAVMVGPGPNGETLPWATNMQIWTQTRKNDIDQTLNTIMVDKFGGSDGFGNLDTALTEFRVSEKRPIVLVQQPNSNPNKPAAVAFLPSCGNAFVRIYNSWFNEPEKEMLLGHEMAHYWDIAQNDTLGQEMTKWVNWGDTAKDYGTRSDREDFAGAVEVYFWPQGDENREWTDDDWAGLALANDPAYGGRGKDGLRLAPNYQSFPLNDNNRLSATGTGRVYDRYDYLECKFSGTDCKP